VLFANFAEALAEGRSRAQAASLRGLNPDNVRKLVMAHTEPPVLGFLGPPRAHVLSLNLELDHLR